jgi:hypothetical protein
MKIKSLNDPKSFIVVLIWSLFMGVTAISIGLGAAFPPLNQIAQPFVCSNGHMQVLLSTSHPQPGTTYTSEKWQCVDNQTGQAQPVNEMSMFLINGLIYGTILFAVIYLWWWVATRRRARRVQQQTAIDVPTTYTPSEELPHLPRIVKFDSLEGYELQELTRMYKEGQFSEAEYNRKRTKILNRMASQSVAETSVDVPEADELRKLKSLLDEGLITEVDYEQKKAAILSRM